MSSKQLKISDRDILSSLTSGKVTEEENPRFEKNIILSSDVQLCQNVDADDSIVDEVVHYLSPASMSVISDKTATQEEYYGAYDYASPTFMQQLHEYGLHTIASYTASTSFVPSELQRTLAIVKPEAIHYQDVILRAIEYAGIKIIHKRRIHLTPEQVSEIYSQHYGSPSFPHMVIKMSVGPILSLCLGGLDVIDKWKNMIGNNNAISSEWFYPISMRKRFGLQRNIPDSLHASENLPAALKENRYFNPDSVIEPLICEEGNVTDYCNLYVNPTLLKGLSETVRVKPADPICYLANWLLKNNPFQPQYPEAIAILPT
ncbi:hypothetical protein PPYR_08012 [Photinus pyralis]|uniref:Nucleoside diphosphate kinase-like domain-containing protein n=2 Tax=Photinus pyralis TaxID=7054 RepID=A0A5N4AS07_PHOPY|nr:nucleoside diphosphate kinase homolog 5-like [Photinus pyralis]KAB0800132.1 hypothetical protein PPYR_08012 [Photinus pyralis]